MEKVIRDGKVAVLISPGFGAGWSTWDHKDQEGLLFDSRIVALVEQDRNEEITEEFMESLGYKDCYCGGADGLVIVWVDEGDSFEITEFDGSEDIHIIGDRDYYTA